MLLNRPLIISLAQKQLQRDFGQNWVKTETLVFWGQDGREDKVLYFMIHQL